MASDNEPGGCQVEITDAGRGCSWLFAIRFWVHGCTSDGCGKKGCDLLAWPCAQAWAELDALRQTAAFDCGSQVACSEAGVAFRDLARGQPDTWCQFFCHFDGLKNLR
jgi:hypothetical protein